MELISREQFERRALALAPLDADDLDQLWQLVSGVAGAAERMKDLAPAFGDEVDVGQFSRTVDGDE